jgi:heme exporter protein CcmD
MPHGPFILAAYSIAAVLLTWCAVAPLLHSRQLKRTILNRVKHMENDNASQP